MKQPKKLTRDLKIAMSKKKLNVDNWLLKKEDSVSWVIVNKKTLKERTIDKS